METHITGNVRALCDAAKASAEALGYRTLTLTTTLNCEAREAGAMLASVAREIRQSGQPLGAPCAVILGGALDSTQTRADLAELLAALDKDDANA